jgi:hypothetical protein
MHSKRHGHEKYTHEKKRKLFETFLLSLKEIMIGKYLHKVISSKAI